MKNLILLQDREAIHGHVRSLWRTEIFRHSHDAADGYIRGLIEQFAAQPRCFYDMTSRYLETAHFSVWFNAIAHRPWYGEDAIHDLYYHHEIAHAAWMTFDAALPWNRWYSKMVVNEFDASMESEVLIYFRLPGLRATAFSHDIWVDRLLARPELGEAFADHGAAGLRRQQAAIEQMRTLRKQAMTAPDPFDFLELQIADYVRSNLIWARIWQARRNDIEAHMAAFQSIAGRDRRAAAEMHRAWLQQRIAEDAADGDVRTAPDEEERAVPFRREAAAFAEHYWRSKEAYGNVRLIG